MIFVKYINIQKCTDITPNSIGWVTTLGDNFFLE